MLSGKASDSEQEDITTKQKPKAEEQEIHVLVY